MLFVWRFKWALVTALIVLAITGGAALALFMSQSNASHAPHARTYRPQPMPSLTPSPTPSPSPTPQPTPAPHVGAVKSASTTAGSGLNFGIAAGGGLADIGTAGLDARFADMKAIGVKWVRYDVQWSDVQPDSASQYNWTPYDRIAQALKAYGLNGLGIIDYTPAWASNPSCSYTIMCEPSSAQAYATFATAVAARYAPMGVHTWEIWNEPNITDSWLPQPDPVLYTQMLKLAYTGIKSADPNSLVLAGSMASCGTGNGNLGPADFLTEIYNNGGRGYFDAVSFHPYSVPFLPAFNYYWNYWQQLATTSPSVRSVMVTHGDGNKKIWITEYGAPTGGPGGQASSGMTMAEQNDDHVTEALQATTVSQAVSLYRTYPWAGGFFWYSYQDNGTDESTTENFYGLLRADGSRKPAYYAYQQAISAAQ